MTKTAEEIYEERLYEAVREIVADHLENKIEFLTVAETLEDEDDDFWHDVYESANEELDTILQRYLDD